MPGLVPGIRVLAALRQERRGWPGTSPAMTGDKHLDNIPIRFIFIPARSPEGTRTGCAVRGVRAGARGRWLAGHRTRAAPGLRPGVLRPPARSSLTAIGSAGRVGGKARQAAEANWRPSTEWPTRSLSRKRGPGAAVKTPRRRAERRRTFARRCAHKDWMRRLARRPPRLLRRGKLPKARARPRRENDGGCPDIPFPFVPTR